MTSTPAQDIIDQIRPTLLPLDHVRSVLASTEPLSTYSFTVGDSIRFLLDADWYHGIGAKLGTDPVNAAITVGRGQGAVTFQLTKDALLEATSACGISKTYASRCPGQLLEPQLNFWFREGLAARPGSRDFQLLVAAGTGVALTRASIRPFSNLRLLDEALDGIVDRFGAGEVLVDFKFTHSLRRTHLRLVIPGHTKLMTGTDMDDDIWSVGLNIKNSLTGEGRTSIDGYLFRWVCANGAIDAFASSGVWSRRAGSNEDEVYEWARAAVDGVLGGAESALDVVQGLVAVPIHGVATDVLRDVFERYHVPLPERTKITENMIVTGDLTMYNVMAAVTEVANDLNLDPGHTESLLRLGGDLPHAAQSRCDACLRMMPH